MRKGFDGLQGLVADVLGQGPLSGHMLLFDNLSLTSVSPNASNSLDLGHIARMTVTIQLRGIGLG
jgi:hypothetical protein